MRISCRLYRGAVITRLHFTLSELMFLFQRNRSELQILRDIDTYLVIKDITDSSFIISPSHVARHNWKLNWMTASVSLPSAELGFTEEHAGYWFAVQYSFANPLEVECKFDKKLPHKRRTNNMGDRNKETLLDIAVNTINKAVIENNISIAIRGNILEVTHLYDD